MLAASEHVAVAAYSGCSVGTCVIVITTAILVCVSFTAIVSPPCVHLTSTLLVSSAAATITANRSIRCALLPQIMSLVAAYSGCCCAEHHHLISLRPVIMRQRRSRLHTFIYHVYIIICKRQRRSSESCDNAEACPTPSPAPVSVTNSTHLLHSSLRQRLYHRHHDCYFCLSCYIFFCLIIPCFFMLHTRRQPHQLPYMRYRLVTLALASLSHFIPRGHRTSHPLPTRSQGRLPCVHRLTYFTSSAMLRQQHAFGWALAGESSLFATRSGTALCVHLFIVCDP